VEVVGLGPHPSHEARELRVVAQRGWGSEMPGDLCLGIAGVNRRVADLMQPDGAELRAALQLRRQVMQGGAGLRRDGAAA